MTVIYVFGGIIALAIFAGVIELMKKYYLSKYDYSIYTWPLLAVLFVVFLLLAIFLMGLNGSVSHDNMIAAAVIGSFLWLIVLIFNIFKTSLIAGIIVTVFQSALAMLLVFLFFIIFIELSGRQKKQEHY